MAMETVLSAIEAEVRRKNIEVFRSQASSEPDEPEHSFMDGELPEASEYRDPAFNAFLKRYKAEHNTPRIEPDLYHTPHFSKINWSSL